MLDSIQVALVVLAALLVGALFPVLLALAGTLRRVRRTLETLEGRAARVLEQSSGVLTNVDQIAVELRQGSGSVSNISRTMEEFANSLARMQRSVKVAAAIGASLAPAIVAGVRSLRGEGDAASGGNGAPGEAAYPPPRTEPAPRGDAPGGEDGP